ncbi:zinc finger protein with KRAB and SCAN domains 8 [Fopius arisanus]|uniref:ZNF519 protein n=1 Tax=Fopius arisanus TaxID=64838 RepID=A0A0C9R2J5_9HYME|nr:PREDICTED: zinc finger protein with KRAB and SCAN domains 8-like [Fopius arisanus]
MNFTEVHGVHGLSQFSELTSTTNSVSSANYAGGLGHQTGGQGSVYTTAAASEQGKQNSLTNGSNKYPGSLLSWPNPNALMQLCEKGLQPLNIPNYSQNNSLLGGQSSVNSLRLLPNMYLPPTSHPESPPIKQEEIRPNGNSRSQSNESPAHIQQQSAAMAEYLQKLQATTLPLTLQQLIKLQGDPVKREEYKEEKSDQSQNNILNIPSVPNFRNNSSQNGNYMNSEQMMAEINPIDLNVHIEDQEASPNAQTIQGQNVKVEQQVQTESPKVEKKMKFRAKVGEIKIAMALDGSMLYCCPECTLAFAEKAEIEQHIQGHVQERKYQCKECGAMLKRKEHLDQHMRGHSDERPFKCPVCQKAFKRNEHLTRHYVIHSGDKNFTCTVCQKAFSRKDHLNKHTQTHLGIRKSKPKKEQSVPETPKDSDTVMDIPKHELSFLLKDGNFAKQDTTFLQHIQNLQKDQNFIHSYSAFKEQMKEGIHQQHAVNMNEILPQNTRYLMPS